MKTSLFAALLAAALVSSVRADERVTVELDDDGATVRVGDELFTRYLVRTGTRPALWPVVGPNGAEVTRSYPVSGLRASESADHVHHRSLWIGYEGLNNVDFWHEPETMRTRHFPPGSVVHREFVRADSTGDVATLGTRNDYQTQDGRTVCHDQRLMEFRAGDDWRAIDFVIDLWSTEGPLEFVDTKEGFFALRVAGTMKVEAELGGKFTNSEGQVDGAAWGKPARWVDYTGPVDGETVGVAVFAHPKAYNPKPRWHVREYGLMAANPFGSRPYARSAEPGGASFEEGEQVRFRYRVLLHNGATDAEWLESEFEKYSKTP